MSLNHGAPETDSEDELPPGWEERATLDGKVFYANHHLRSTQWTHPRTGKKKKVLSALPFGWEQRVLEDGKVIYVDHENKRTSYADPRLAFAFEENKVQPTVMDTNSFRQRFDASSNALQVLHGLDLSNKVAIVTGSNCGIGFEIAKSFAYHGCQVVLACRRLQAAQEAMDKIRKDRPSAKCFKMKVDLTSLASVKAFAEEFKNQFEKLDVLVLNAGVFAKNGNTTYDGLEETFQVNYLSQVYLAHLLLDQMAATLSPKLIVISAESHRFSEISIDSLSNRFGRFKQEEFIPINAYNDSKLFGLMFALQAHEFWHKFGIRAVAVHPGNMVSSYLARHSWFYRLIFAMVRPWCKSLQQAASTPVFAAFAPEMNGVSGLYLNNCFPCQPSELAQNRMTRVTLWNLTQDLLQQKLKDIDSEFKLL